MLITFSGLDGAGKSTLIYDLKTSLEKKGRRVEVLNMYDHVGLYAFMRFVRNRQPGQTSHSSKLFYKIARSHRVKRLICIFDLFIFFIYRFYFERVKKCVLIIDRYFYDTFVDVADGKKWRYIKSLLFFTPVPNIPIFVDIDPEKAFARKGEGSIEYLRRRYIYYQKISSWVRGSFVLPNEDMYIASRIVNAIVSEKIGKNDHSN